MLTPGDLQDYVRKELTDTFAEWTGGHAPAPFAVDFPLPAAILLTDDNTRAAVRWTLTWTHNRALHGIWPTGRAVELQGCHVVEEIGAGPTWRVTRYIDWLSFYAQLGLGLTGRPTLG